MDAPQLTACSVCGRSARRQDLFGVEPDLLCEPCAQSVRERMFVRFRPQRRSYGQGATLTLLGIMGALFLLTDVVFAGEKQPPTWLEDLYPWVPIWDGEVWRHLTSVFLHAGFLHFALNGMALWTLGRAVEFAYGPLALVALTVSTGVVGSIAQWAMVTGTGVGISGALFGLAGFLFALRRSNAVAAAVMNQRTINMLITWFLLCIVLSQTGQLRIANWAHGGGLVWGLLCGYATAHRARRAWIALVTVATVLLWAASPLIALGEQANFRAYHFWLKDLRPLLLQDDELLAKASALETLYDDDIERAQADPNYVALRAEIDAVREQIEALQKRQPPLPASVRKQR